MRSSDWSSDVGSSDLDRADGEFLDLVVAVGLGKIPRKRAAEQGQVARAGVMAVGGQAGGVDEVGVLQAQLFGVRVHQLRERGLAAGDVLGQGDGRVVA